MRFLLETVRSVCGVGLLAGLLTGCAKPSPKTATAPPQAAPPVETPASPPPAPPAVVTKEPEPDAVALLFPHKPGSAWQYKETSTREGETRILDVQCTENERIEPNGRKTFFRVMRDEKKEIVQSEAYQYDDKGIYWVATGPGGANKLDPPMMVLQLPFKSDTGWEWKGTIQGDQPPPTPAKAAFKLLPSELVTTPLKTFRAYRLEQTLTYTTADGTETVSNSQWFSPDVGLVKQETRVGNDKITAELISYKVGK